MIQRRTSWFASLESMSDIEISGVDHTDPCSGPASPKRAAEYDKYGSLNADPTKSKENGIRLVCIVLREHTDEQYVQKRFHPRGRRAVRCTIGDIQSGCRYHQAPSVRHSSLLQVE